LIFLSILHWMALWPALPHLYQTNLFFHGFLLSRRYWFVIGSWRWNVWRLICSFKSFANSFLSSLSFGWRTFYFSNAKCITESPHFLYGLGLFGFIFSLNFEFVANDKPFTFDNSKDHTKCNKMQRDIVCLPMLSEFWENSFSIQPWWACNESLFMTLVKNTSLYYL